MATGLENPFILPEEFDLGADALTKPDFELNNRLVNRWKKDVPEALAEESKGKINKAEVVLRFLGAVGGSVGDILGAPLDAAMNALGVNDALAKQVQRLAETETGKEIVKWSQENPRATKDILAGMDAASFFPAVKTVSKALNKAARGSRTMVEGGTIGDVVHKARVAIAEKKGVEPPKKMNFYNTGGVMFLGDLVDGMIGGAYDSLTPSGAAAARKSGILSNARKEIKKDVEAGKTLRAEQAAMAKRMLAQQAGVGEPGMLSKGSPLYDYYLKDANIQVSGPKGRFSRPNNIPWNQEGLDRVKKHFMDAGLDEQAADRVIADFKMNVFSNKGATGASGAWSKFNEWWNPSKEGMSVDVWNPSAGESFRELGMVPFDRAASPTINRLYHADKWKAIPEEIRDDPYTLAKMAKLADSREFRGKNSQVDAFKSIVSAFEKKQAGAELNPVEQKILKDLDEVKGVNPPNAEDPRQYLGTSYVSNLMSALGGLHTVSILDKAMNWKKAGTMPQITNVAGDKHDIFGANFLFPQMDKAVVIPPQTRAVGNESLTTMRRKDLFNNKSEVPVNMEEIRKLEELSGVPYRPGENPIDYQLRAIGEFSANPELRDYATVLKNAGMLGYLGSDWRQQMENDN